MSVIKKETSDSVVSLEVAVICPDSHLAELENILLEINNLLYFIITKTDVIDSKFQSCKKVLIGCIDSNSVGKLKDLFSKSAELSKLNFDIREIYGSNSVLENKLNDITVNNKLRICINKNNINNTDVICKNSLPTLYLESADVFGDGRHETTMMCLESIIDVNLKNKKVLDFGCGTGILGLASSKLGANKVTCVDNDTSALNNAYSNLILNKDITDVDIIHSKLFVNNSYDFILANIYLNDLLNLAGVFFDNSRTGTILCLSGVLSEQLHMLQAGYTFLTDVKQKTNGLWGCLVGKVVK